MRSSQGAEVILNNDGQPNVGLSQYMSEEQSLLGRLFDPQLLKVECQIARKSLINLYDDLIDNNCLSENQAVFIAQYSVSCQGI